MQEGKTDRGLPSKFHAAARLTVEYKFSFCMCPHGVLDAMHGKCSCSQLQQHRSIMHCSDYRLCAWSTIIALVMPSKQSQHSAFN